MENEGETESNSFWLGIKKSRYSRLNRSSPLLFSFSPFFLHVRISVFYYYYFRFVEIMRTSLIKFYFVFQEKIRYGETKSMKQTFRIRLIIEMHELWITFQKFRNKDKDNNIPSYIIEPV